MGERRLAVRILGVACTAHGFAFALTEGPDRLLDCGGHGGTPEKIRNALERVIARSRPLFVACEVARNEKRSGRARIFNWLLKAACRKYAIMILCVERRCGEGYGPRGATNYEMAQAAARRFRVIAYKLPRPRRLWEGVDDRIGIFLAAAAAIAGWNHFCRPD